MNLRLPAGQDTAPPLTVQGHAGGLACGMKAMWNGHVIAQSDDTVVVEGNHYFPVDSVNPEYLSPSATHTTCPWKGEASYHTLTVDGQENRDAAWYYPQPKDAARQIAGRVAFWKGVQVTPD